MRSVRTVSPGPGAGPNQPLLLGLCDRKVYVRALISANDGAIFRPDPDVWAFCEPYDASSVCVLPVRFMLPLLRLLFCASGVLR